MKTDLYLVHTHEYSYIPKGCNEPSPARILRCVGVDVNGEIRPCYEVIHYDGQIDEVPMFKDKQYLHFITIEDIINNRIPKFGELNNE